LFSPWENIVDKKKGAPFWGFLFGKSYSYVGLALWG
jgi:hypothetical protein